jgi:hypothetical protein
MPSGTPTSTPTFVIPLDGIDADVVDVDVVDVAIAVVVTGWTAVEFTVVDEEVNGTATEPDIEASVVNALGAGIVKLPQPGETPQTHDPMPQPQDH